MINQELQQRFEAGEEFEIIGNDRLSDGIYKFFKGCHPATASFLFLRQKSALGRYENAPYTGLQAAHLNKITDEWVDCWVSMGDSLFILKNQIKFNN